MRKTSEWVSLGHPDKMADYISSFILDRYLERDPMTRYRTGAKRYGPHPSV